MEVVLNMHSIKIIKTDLPAGTEGEVFIIEVPAKLCVITETKLNEVANNLQDYLDHMATEKFEDEEDKEFIEEVKGKQVPEPEGDIHYES
jgi:hypothetical protein